MFDTNAEETATIRIVQKSSFTLTNAKKRCKVSSVSLNTVLKLT